MKTSQVNVTGLHYLVEVADAGGFSQAANRLGLNPSTLSRRVSEIEDSLGLTLWVASLCPTASTTHTL